METKEIKEMKKEERITLLEMKIKCYLRGINDELLRGKPTSAECWYNDLFQACRILQNICIMDGWEGRFYYLVRL